MKDIDENTLLFTESVWRFSGFRYSGGGRGDGSIGGDLGNINWRK